MYDAGRLQVINACQTVTGSVTETYSSEDGDIDIRVALDPAYTALLNTANITKIDGHLQVEAICQAAATTASAQQACGNFHGSVTVPAVGDRVSVTGTYVLDTRHGWTEIHPVSVITSLP